MATNSVPRLEPRYSSSLFFKKKYVIKFKIFSSLEPRQNFRGRFNGKQLWSSGTRSAPAIIRITCSLVTRALDLDIRLFNKKCMFIYMVSWAVGQLKPLGMQRQRRLSEYSRCNLCGNKMLYSFRSLCI